MALEVVLFERATVNVHGFPSRHIPNFRFFSESISDGTAILAVRGNTFGRE